jgi:hypothetical protein
MPRSSEMPKSTEETGKSPHSTSREPNIH